MQYISQSEFTPFEYLYNSTFHLEPRVTVHKRTSQNTKTVKKNLKVFTTEVNEQLKAGVKYDGGKVEVIITAEVIKKSE